MYLVFFEHNINTYVDWFLKYITNGIDITKTNRWLQNRNQANYRRQIFAATSPVTKGVVVDGVSRPLTPSPDELFVTEFRGHEPCHPTSCRWREFAVANPATRRVVGDEASWPLTPSRILEYTSRKYHPVCWMFFIYIFMILPETQQTGHHHMAVSFYHHMVVSLLLLASTHVLKLYDGLKDWQPPSPSELSVTKFF